MQNNQESIFRSSRGDFANSLLSVIQKGGMALVLVIVMAFMAIIAPKFLTPRNLINVAVQNCILAIVAMGISYVLISGGIDLSIGSVIGTVAILTSGLYQYDGFLEWQAILISFIAALTVGLVNGLIIIKFKLEPVVVTLGTWYIVRGLIQTYILSRVPTAPPITSYLGSENLFGIPIILIITVIIAIVTHLILTKTVLGRWAYAMGGNNVAARLSGVPVDRARIIFYMLSSLYAAIAGVLLSGRIHAVDANTGDAMIFLAYAAAVVGGTSLFGGRGSALNAIIGALIIGVIANGLNLTRLVHFWQQVAIGAAILIAVTIDATRSRRE
ncbi:MAG: ABC transporter permease [Anaerolineales bacterium]|jgi:ribose transport system permease protein